MSPSSWLYLICLAFAIGLALFFWTMTLDDDDYNDPDKWGI